MDLPSLDSGLLLDLGVFMGLARSGSLGPGPGQTGVPSKQLELFLGPWLGFDKSGSCLASELGGDGVGPRGYKEWDALHR